MVAKEVPQKGAMQLIKDVVDPHNEAQLLFYLQNIPFMTRVKDMSEKN